MTRRDYRLIVVLVIVSGLVGGSFTSWMLIGTRAFAEGNIQEADLIKAKAIQIVDDRGRVRVDISLKRQDLQFHGGPVRILGKGVTPDSSGTVIDTALVKSRRWTPEEPKVEILDETGAVIWSAPPEDKAVFIR